MLINFNFYYIHSIFIICIYRFKYMYLFNSEKPHRGWVNKICMYVCI